MNIHLLLLASAVIVTSACSAQQWYASGQAQQRQQCARIVDTAEYQRCMDKTQKSYEDYRRER
jgi:hypothetical protein